MDSSLLSLLVSAGIIFVFLALGIPVGVTLGLAGVVGGLLFTGRLTVGLGILHTVALTTTTNYGFIVVPLFMVLGMLGAASGIARDLFNAAYRWVARVPGGLSVTTVLTCAGMAAITGSSVGTAAAMTRIALPELRRMRYQDSLSAGTIAVAGTLAIMIPPSTVFVLYGIFAEQSIGKLLIAGILPGLLIAMLYAGQVILRCTLRPELGPVGPKSSWREKFRSLAGVVPFLSIIILVMLGILLGIFTPVEASAVGVVLVFLVGQIQRRLSLRATAKALLDSVVASASVMVLVIGALTYSAFIGLTGYNVALTNYIVGLGLPPIALFSILVVLYLILGMFLEGASMLALTVPLVLPTVIAVGWDPIWFGVIVVSMVEIALVTPPVGLNLYVVKAGAPDIPTETIIAGALPFWLCNIVAIYIIYFIPSIALFLPARM